MITLRPFRLSDVDDLMSYAGDDQVTRSLRWKTLTTRDEALTFIKDVCKLYKADLGHVIAAKYWGQGITTKAVKIAVSQVFHNFPILVRLQAFADVENYASQRVLEKSGFQREGVLRKYGYLKGNIKDLVVYRFLSTEVAV
ncbi:hypothetical protein L3X38_035646 [Prunus dulcis]|uniref:N-acetyltransferase domain-containing protein n=1 Tax=Prunus dulcis TaxID=3755 RepID=A0AAD4YY12_PRUDU|nr:hypothetical protein L3X38_035646 [Prunus dulcis]